MGGEGDETMWFANPATLRRGPIHLAFVSGMSQRSGWMFRTSSFGITESWNLILRGIAIDVATA